MLGEGFDRWWFTILSAVGAIVVMFILAKLMGKRQVSQLSLFDYINGITLGSIAAELATATGDTFIRPLIALVVYALIEVAISILGNKSIALRRLFEGRPIVLVDGGDICFRNFKRAKIDLNEFLTGLRYEGYFDLDDVETAVFETNGMISILPKSTARPATPEDLGLEPAQDKLVANVVIDGRVMPKILKRTGNNEQWLRRQLDSQGVKLEDCVLGTVDGDNVFRAYEESDSENQKYNPFI